MGIFLAAAGGDGAAGWAGTALVTGEGTAPATAGAASRLPVVARNFLRLTEGKLGFFDIDASSLNRVC
jgi:hypothetical protein